MTSTASPAVLTPSAAEDISSLASSFEGSSSADTASQPSLPLSVLLYRTGRVLYDRCVLPSLPTTQHPHPPTPADDGHDAASSELTGAFRTMVRSLPRGALGDALDDVNGAFLGLVSSPSAKSPGDDDVARGLRSLCGIYASSPEAAGVGFSVELLSALNSLYEELTSEAAAVGGDGDGDDGAAAVLMLELASNLLVHGLIMGTVDCGGGGGGDGDDEDARQQQLDRILRVLSSMSEEGTNLLGDVQRHRTGDALSDAVVRKFADPTPEREYILNMLSSFAEAAARSPAAAAATAAGNTPLNAAAASWQGDSSRAADAGSRRPPPPASARRREDDRIQSLVAQVSAVLPHLGEGYVQTALACYDFDPEKTAQHLLAGTDDPTSLHPRLRALDPRLPKLLRKTSDDVREGDADLSKDREAKERQKALVKEMEVQAENEAYLLSTALEYNDDYDDQYDDMGDQHVGARDDGVYDSMDYEAIKLYNRAMKEEGTEEAFWAENRNTNRPREEADKNENGGESDDALGPEGGGNGKKGSGAKSWGPDKGKGGRIIGPDGKYLPHKKRGGGGRGGARGGGRGRGGVGRGSGDGDGGGGAGGDKKGGVGGAGNTTSGAGASSEMSKIQKRRKNDNKAKVANHHRKERALKKTGGI